MTRWKLYPVLLAAACLALPATALAQARAAGGARSGGTAVPRAAGAVARPVVVGPGRVGVNGYRPYYYPYRFYPGLSFGFGFGYPYYYGYPWGYPYPYFGYGYGYPGYAYAYPPSANGAGWGGVRIEDAPKDAQVFADGYYVGIVDDFNGATQHLTLEAGVHEIEIRVPGQAPRKVDVNIAPGQTINYHAR